MDKEKMQPTMLTYIKETPAQLAYNNEHSNYKTAS